MILLVFALVSVVTPSVGAEGSSPPRVTEVRIAKGDHRLTLVAGDQVVKSYRVAIGPGGPGPKLREGDSVTPVGTYRIVGRIKGLFHQFLTVSYPNQDDLRRYAELKRSGGVKPGVGVGGGIGIHGTGHKEWNGVHKESDWTLGCVALDDDEIDEVAAQVKDGTPVVISD
jgi:murein L,D-transpeptidase YafK